MNKLEEYERDGEELLEVDLARLRQEDLGRAKIAAFIADGWSRNASSTTSVSRRQSSFEL